MLSKKPARILIFLLFVAVLVVIGIARFKDREVPTAPLQQASQPALTDHATPLAAPSQPQPAQVPVAGAPLQAQALNVTPEQRKPGTEEVDRSSPITAFRHWAETAAAVGLDNADHNRGMELAHARAADMKALIKKNPAAALRQALPANLRAALPPAIASTIEQPVKKTGTVSMRMMCNHSPNTPHGNCMAEPVLLEDINSWNAYYDEQKWRTHLGQTVELEGIAVDEEVAVSSVSPVPTP